MTATVTFPIPLRTYSEANRREHWAAKAKRTKEQRIAARWFCGAKMIGGGLRPPLSITLTRISPRKLDTDNLARSMKAVRDGIADALGIDDGDDRLEWRYAQRKGRAKEYSVDVEISGKET